MRGLTARQEAILDFIRDRIEVWGYPPTLREIACHFGLRSANGVNDHLNALARKGYIVRDEMKSRAIRIVPWKQRAEARP